MKRKISMDIVRILAMFLIVIFHWNGFKDSVNIDTGYVFFHYIANGTIANIGVSLFFILSGASLMISNRGKLEVKKYYKKRFLAIYPMYWVFYAAMFFYAHVLRKTPITAPIYTLIYTVFGMDGFLAYKVWDLYMIGEWFVGCIIIIYLIFPLLHTCVRKWPVRSGVIAMVLYILLVIFYPFEMEALHFPLVRVPEVMFGMYFIKWLDLESDKKKVIWSVSGVISLVVFLVFVFVPIGIPSPFTNMILGVSLYIFLTWVFDFVKDTDKPGIRIIKFISNYSYAVFLLHHAVIGECLIRFSGRSISTVLYYGLFAVYIVVLFIAAVILTKITNLIIRRK